MKKFTRIHISFFLLLIISIFFSILISSSEFNKNKPIYNYNNFRLYFSDIIYYIENNWEQLNQQNKFEELSHMLNEKNTELKLFDIKTSNFVFSNIKDTKFINQHIKTYLFFDKNVQEILSDKKILISEMLFKDDHFYCIAIFIFDKEIIINYDKSLKNYFKSMIIIAIIISIYFLYNFLIVRIKLKKTVDLLKLEMKKISSFQLKESINYNFNDNIFSECFYELERTRETLKDSIENNIILEENRKTIINYLTHDLKTPITSIRALTEGLLDNIVKTNEKREEYLKSILSKTFEIEKLANDLFNHSNFSDSRFKIEKKEVYFDELVNNIIINLKSIFQTYEFKYIYEIKKIKKIVSVDSFRIEQAVLNLVINSIKYSDKKKELKIFTEENENYCVIGVEDQGIGISKEDIPFIFDVFYRSEKSRSKKFGGTGLGLSIVKSILEAHEGTVSVKSIIAKGTIIKLYIPII
jgi:signal transduction histidine kinase